MGSTTVHVSRLAPNDILVVNGPAIIHLNHERGSIVAATNAPDSTGIVHIKGRDFAALKKQHGSDASAIVDEVKGDNSN